MSPNNRTLLNGVSRPKLLNISLPSCFLINFDFKLQHLAHFDNSIVLTLVVLKNSFGNSKIVLD